VQALRDPALLLPALGDVLTIYAPPLIVARLLTTFAERERLTFADFIPYLAAFASLWIAGRSCGASRSR
jgi:hypothetical protein